MKLAIATPFYEMKGWSPYIASLAYTAKLLTLAGIDFEFLAREGDSYVWRAKNTLANRFLQSDCTDLLFIDSDEAWKLDGLMRLLKHDVDIVGVGYPCKNRWDFYGCLLNTHPDGRPIVNEAGLLSAHVVPGGFLRIRRGALEKLGATCQPFAMEDGSKGFDFFSHIGANGEDGSFCLRCEAAGILRWVEPDVTITHYGVRGWQGNYHEFLLRQPGGSECRAVRSTGAKTCSIVITCFNYGQYLAEAIESALAQTVKCEVIVVDDGSSDNSAEIAAKYPVTVIRQSNQGISAARNAGIALAKGEYILPLDADDRIDPTYVEKALAKMIPGIGIVNCGMREFGDSEREFMPTDVSLSSMLQGNTVYCCSMFPKAVWEDVGGYDENMPVGGYEDWELWIRILAAGYQVAPIQEYLFFYRKHGKSMIDGAIAKHAKLVTYIQDKHRDLYDSGTGAGRTATQLFR